MEYQCTCSGLQKAIKKGVKKLKEQEAPKFLINDYIRDMLYGNWIKCKCNKPKQ